MKFMLFFMINQSLQLIKAKLIFFLLITMFVTGSYRTAKKDVAYIDLHDLENPFTLFHLLFSEEEFIKYL